MKETATRNKAVELCIIHGVEGDCVVLNDYRIAGPKPWGGGSGVKEQAWQVDIELIKEALKSNKIK